MEWWVGQLGDFKHLDKEFRTENKEFLLSVINGAQIIKVIERNRIIDYQISFDLGGADWFGRQWILKGNKAFFQKFRGRSYALLVHIKFNRRGRFLEVSRMQNGVLRSIVVPGGSSGNRCRGWRDLLGCLESILGRRKVAGIDCQAGINGGVDSRSGIRVKKGNSRVQQQHSGEEDQTSGSRRVHKNWRFSVVIYRDYLEVQWSVISNGLSKNWRDRC